MTTQRADSEARRLIAGFHHLFHRFNRIPRARRFFFIRLFITGLAVSFLPAARAADPGVKAVQKPAFMVTYITEDDIDGRSYRTLLELRETMHPKSLQNLEAALLEIMDTINPDLYGLGKKFTYPLVKNQNNELFLLSDLGAATNRNFDCLDAAITVKEILKKHYLRGDIYRGASEHGIFSTHYFVVVDGGLVIDGTPVFPLLGARHTATRRVPLLEIQQYIEKGFSKIGGVRPLSFSRSGKTVYHSLLGVEDNPRPLAALIHSIKVSGEYPHIVFQYQMNEIVDYSLTRRYVLNVLVTLPEVKEFLLRKINTEPDGYAAYRSMSIADLAAAGALRLTEEGMLVENGAAESPAEQPVPVHEVQDLKDRAQPDMPIAAEFLKNVIYTTYLIQQL